MLSKGGRFVVVVYLTRSEESGAKDPDFGRVAGAVIENLGPVE